MTLRADNTGLGGELGPSLQAVISAAQLGLNAQVPASGQLQSAVLLSNGWKYFALGLKSTQAGAVTIQRFLDAAGTVAIGAPVTATLTANTAQTVSIGTADTLPFMSYQVTVTNTGGAAATLSNVAGLLQAN
ncbi:hypothetical protein [Paraburkholderia sp. BL17N1]|uniref:hypothetical protein n=1 Tax=Paraburkholderia sp. BL17N1 TaxID=1938798 RepID=UPI000EB20F5C|nr:hypothetical protein [Paraburkholderia sp. BL17N1]RKR46309.1 hypothetical protein B0G82_3992 [Paraburkholderia sp. BL17N1]